MSQRNFSSRVTDAAQAGQTLYLAARWATQKGDLSPWSPMIHFTVLAAG